MTSINDIIVKSKTLYRGDKLNTITLYDPATNVQLKAHQTISSNIILTLPDHDGNSGQFLTSDGSGILTWENLSNGGMVMNTGDETISGTKTFSSTINGDISGNSETTTISTSTSTSTNVIVSETNSTNESVYPLFVGGVTGSQGVETGNGLTYNPGTGVLTTSQFVCDLLGNASVASTVTVTE